MHKAGRSEDFAGAVLALRTNYKAKCNFLKLLDQRAPKIYLS